MAWTKIYPDVTGKPNLPRRLFWEFNYDVMDWKAMFRTVIQRVLDRGNEAELAEAIRFYGKDTVIDVLKNAPIYLMDHSIERACKFFHFKPEELHCYHRKRERGGHWL